MRTFKIVAGPNLYFPLPGRGAQLTEELLVERLAGIVVHELSVDPSGQWTVQVQLDRSSDEQALEDIVSLLEQLGYRAIEATVSEWASAVVERGLIGLLTGGGIGAATRNEVAAVLGAFFGALIGGLSGAEVRELRAEYAARRDRSGNWSLRELPRASSPKGLDPGFSPA